MEKKTPQPASAAAPAAARGYGKTKKRIDGVFRLKEVKSSSHTSPAVGLMVLAACLAVLCSNTAWALGTPAGTVIANTATVVYTVAGNPMPQSVSAVDTFSVLEVIDAVLTWQDGGPVAVNSPQNARALTFLLTNTGNGPEAFALTAVDTLGGDDFDPGAPSLWIESNGIPGPQTAGATPDTLYQTGANEPELPADGAVLIYLLSSIPAGLSDAAAGRIQLFAASTTPGADGAVAGTTLSGAGSGGVDAVVGSGNADAIGAYVVAAVAVNINKSIVQIADRFGGNQPYPGARVTYRLTVTVAGSGTAEALTITDTIPGDMTFAPGSIMLDGTAQTDAADADTDRSDFNVTSADTVTVTLNDTAAPATHIIEFTTTIN